MNEEAARLLLDEMKNGLNNVHDFYGNEFFEYFYAENIMIMVVSIFFLLGGIGSLIGGLRHKNVDALIAACFGLIPLIGLVTGICYQYLLISAPKVYITKEIMSMFGD